MEFDFEQAYDNGVKIKVIGVGGGGNNAVNRMISANIRGVEFIAANTDAQVLDTSCASKRLILGSKVTRGLGAGAKPEVGRRAAEESIEEIKKCLEGADMLFITAGMGGGTGTGAAPVIAKVAKELDILTVGIVTKPFNFEGRPRYLNAEKGIAELAKYVDSLIVIPNERLKEVEGARITLANAFEIADDVLRRGVQSVSEIINVTGFVNRDFADVTTIMKDAGYAHMGVGSAKGQDKAQLAAMAAISSPLLETSIAGATGVLMSITASEDITLEDVEIASNMVYEEAAPDATIIWGAAFNPELQDEMRITIIATGFLDSNTNEKGISRKDAEMAKAESVAEEAARSAAIDAPAHTEPKVIDYAPAQEEAAKPVEAPAHQPTVIKVSSAPKVETEESIMEDLEDTWQFIKRKSKTDR
ncbi:MAG: cell division protein FtsZ [Clostridia bacterium]|nr:cell division protein FtsZ [Clostridia bacterium]